MLNQWFAGRHQLPTVSWRFVIVLLSLRIAYPYAGCTRTV